MRAIFIGRRASIAGRRARFGLNVGARPKRLLAVRLPPFEAARRAFDKAASELQERLVRQPNDGRAPRSLESRVKGLSDDEQGRVVREWLGDQISKSTEVRAARARYEALTDVVPTALELGMLRLQRAAGLEGEARERVVGNAEHSFLAIQAEAAGSVDYHLGLGQVYHRLGKAEAGDQELQVVLDRKEPMLSLGVARVYRGLGLVARARGVPQAVFERGDAAWHVARLVGQAEPMARGRAVFERKGLGLELRIELPLKPDSKGGQLRMKWFEAGGLSAG